MNPMQWLRDAISPEERRSIGDEAKQALENRHWREAFDAVEGYVIERGRSCDARIPGHAEDVVRCLQLLTALKRELVRKIEDGEMARTEIAQLEKQQPILRRMVR